MPDPGVLPTLPSPVAGDRILIHVEGLPPHKDTHFSIRNPRHRKYDRFQKLRQEAIKAMAGRKWYDDVVQLIVKLFASSLDRPLIDYIGGIADTLDGSHGEQFTYLPIVYQDDCQICDLGESEFIKSDKVYYYVEVLFM